MNEDKKEILRRLNRNEVKEKKHGFINFILALVLIFTLGLGVYYVVKNIDNLDLVINGSLITLIIFLFIILIFIKKELGKKVLGLFIGILFIGLIGYNLLEKTQTNVTLTPNFVGENIQKGLSWASSNKIEVSQVYEYSDNIEEFSIISQSATPNEPIDSIDKINFIVSNGPNYEKEVIIPNMLGWNIDEAVEVIKENYLNNVIINYVKNEEKKDIIIGQNKSGQIKRNTKIILTVSLSNEKLPDVSMIDLVNMSNFDATLWLKRNGLNYKINYEFSNTIKKDYVISQDVDVNTILSPSKDLVTITISKGKEIMIPDFKSMTVKEATDFIIQNKLKVTFKEEYSNMEVGKIIKANYSKGDLVEEGTNIVITTSLGKLKMKEFKKYQDFKAWADSLNLNYDLEDVYSDKVEPGYIISTDPKVGEYIDTNKKILVKYSKGGKITIPNFYNQSKTYIKNKCSEIGLVCSFNYSSYNDTIKKDYAVSQQFKSGTTVPKNTSMYITLSSGSAKTYSNIVIQEGWLAIGNTSKTISNLKSKLTSLCPGVTFNIVKKSHNTLTSGLIHPSSPIQGGKAYTFTQGKTYSIYIVG